VICGLLFLFGLTQAQLFAEETEIETLPPAAKTQVDFSRDIEPLFRERCQSCHGTAEQMGGLRLDNRTAAMAGGYSGAVIQPGNSAASKLVHLIAGLKKGLIMPMAGDRLTAEQVGLVRAWIDQGAEWPEQIGSANALEPGAISEQALGLRLAAVSRDPQSGEFYLGQKRCRCLCSGEARERESPTIAGRRSEHPDSPSQSRSYRFTADSSGSIAISGRQATGCVRTFSGSSFGFTSLWREMG
jgi:mono/diheme cytochrome c family protein